MALKGGPELWRRLRALRLAFKPLGRDWADDYVHLGRPQLPVKTGKLRRSLRRKNATQRKATVVGDFTAYFVDAGAKVHTISPKKEPRLVFDVGGRTIFAKKVHHPGVRARPFRKRIARESLRRNPMAAYVIDAWNKAA